MNRLQMSFAAAGFAALLVTGCASSKSDVATTVPAEDEVIVVNESPTTTTRIVETTVPIENPSMVSSSQMEDETPTPTRERMRKD